MAGIWMPPPPAIIRPVVLEPLGMPEIVCHGGIIRFDSADPAKTKTILYQRCGSERTGVLRIVMLPPEAPEDGFDVSLVRAYVETMFGTRH